MITKFVATFEKVFLEIQSHLYQNYFIVSGKLSFELPHH